MHQGSALTQSIANKISHEAGPNIGLGFFVIITSLTPSSSSGCLEKGQTPHPYRLGMIFFGFHHTGGASLLYRNATNADLER